jgi:DnaJ-class molecular chaperone
MSQDLYRLLGLEKNANPNDIKKAYQRGALKHHPDKGGDEETFKKVQQAYEVLSDDGKRKHYDMTGQIPGDQPQGPPGGFPFPFDIGNLFGMFGPGGRPQNQKRGFKPPPKTETIKIGLAQLYFGHSFQIHLDRNKMCGPCSGSGAKRKEPCSGCGGIGTKTQTINLGGMMMHSQGPCPACSGEGMKTVEVCSTCNGLKKVQEKKAIDVKLPAGTQDGETFAFAEVCSEMPEFEKAGDLVLTVKAEMTDGWKRTGAQGQHLEHEVVLNLAEALLGTTVKLDGHPGFDEGLFLEIPAGSFTDDSYCLTGQGMPLKGSANSYGDLYIKIRVTVKMAERKGLVSEEIQKVLGPVFKDGCRTVEGAVDVQKELFLTKLP